MEYLLFYRTFIGTRKILGMPPEIILKISQTEKGLTSAELCVLLLVSNIVYSIWQYSLLIVKWVI